MVDWDAAGVDIAAFFGVGDVPVRVSEVNERGERTDWKTTLSGNLSPGLRAILRSCEYVFDEREIGERMNRSVMLIARGLRGALRRVIAGLTNALHNWLTA